MEAKLGLWSLVRCKDGSFRFENRVQRAGGRVGHDYAKR